MLELHEDGNVVFINPYHVAMVRPQGDHSRLTLSIGTSIVTQISVDEAAEEVATGVGDLLYPQEHIEAADMEVDLEALEALIRERNESSGA